MSPDIFNGIFELVAGCFIWLSVRKLHQEKLVRGVHWLPIGFFMVWGYWNLFYYPHLGQWFSFWGGIGVVMTNTLWVLMATRYIIHEREAETAFNDLDGALEYIPLDTEAPPW